MSIAEQSRAESSPTDHSPRERIEHRLVALRTVVEALDRRHVVLGNSKAGLVALALGLTWASCGAKVLPLSWVALPLFVLVVLWVLHEQVLTAKRRAERAIQHHERAVARLEDRWATLAGGHGERFLDPKHPYAIDLDLFGRGSLFALLSQVRTREGEARLADWLLHPSDVEEIHARREAVRELSSRVELREDIAVLGPEIDEAADLSALARWSADPVSPPTPGPLALALLALVATASGIALLLWFAGRLSVTPLALLVLVQTGFRLRYGTLLRGVSRDAFSSARNLAVLRDLLRRIEHETFAAPRLAALRARLESEGHLASREIRSLVARVDAFEARRNPVFLPFVIAMSLDLFAATRIESWRRRVGPRVSGWLDSIAELEALLSLSGYAFEHPDDAWPEVERAVGGEASYRAEGLRHPLLSPRVAVSNDVALRSAGTGGPAPALHVISGSNMSGKSTLLRAVGLGAVLAQAGAPVPARKLRMTPLQVGASIRVQDSLLEGASRFWAEVQRLKQVVDLSADGTGEEQRARRPLLYLIDEILQGTNSHDRSLGVEAVLRELVERGAIGMITTHDLALTAIAERLAPDASNVHFEDQWEDGRMLFDYRLRPGIVARSNALALMRAVGLRVDA